MSPFADTTVLTAYVLGDLTPDHAAEVERAAQDDPNLAAKLACLAAVVGGDLTGARPETLPFLGLPRTRRDRRQFLRWAAGGLGAAALVGTTYAGYHILSPRPLLEDAFDDGWLDTRKWDVSRGRPGVREGEGHMRLKNRGSIVTAREFPEPIEVSFDWMWADWAEDRQYSEDLRVALRTSGRHHDQHSFQIVDGVVVCLATRGACSFIDVVAGTEPPNLTRFRRLASTPDGTIPMPADEWHHVRITDDGRTVAIYVSGPSVDEKYTATPVVVADYDGVFAERRIAIYNREHIAGAQHESRIDNFQVWRLADRRA